MKFDTFGDLNYLAVAVGAIVYWLLGALWYAPPVFGKRWQTLSGVAMGEGASPMLLFGATLVLNFVTVLAVAFLAAEAGAANLNDALQLGLGTSIAFTAIGIAMTQVYEGRPRALVAINATYHVIGITLASVIVTLWD